MRLTETLNVQSERLLAHIQCRPRIYIASTLVASACLLLIAAVVYSIVRPPAAFPINTPVVIESGMTAGDIADQLADEHVVRFADLLYVVLVLLHDPAEIKAGAYVFHDPQNVFAIARQITDDSPQMQHVSLTFYEGTTAAHYARTAAKYLSDFDPEFFERRGRSYEGFLFPDTYFVPYEYTAEDLITLLFETYHEQVAPLMATKPDNLTEYEVITIASLLEREGNELENMRMIAGILFNRLELGMPLQLDASMEYVLDKPLDQLTPADLQKESPYNTYLNTGLPPTPIGNPGIQAITAALNPTPSEYLFYITGNDGNFYYAETFEEHRENIERYLR